LTPTTLVADEPRGAPPYSQPVELPDAINQIRGAVVQITYTISGLSHEALEDLGADGAIFSRPFGSGFFISDRGHVVTAKHVLDDIEDFAIDNRDEGQHYVGIGVAFPNIEGHGVQRRGTFRSIAFDVVGTDDRHDLALLRLVRNPFAMSRQDRTSSQGQLLEPSLAVLDATRPRDGASAAISGYPLDQAALVTTAGHIASGWAVDIKNQLISDGAGGYEPTDIADRYLADIQTNPGNSGGPAYSLGSGAVLGVLVGAILTHVVGDSSLRSSANLAEVVPAQFVVELAAKHGVNVRTLRPPTMR